MSHRRRRPAPHSLPRHVRAAAAVATFLAAIALTPAGAGAATDPSVCTVTWDGGAGSTSWGEAANWSTNRLPESTDTVCIGPTAKVESWGFGTVGALHVDGSLKVSFGSLRITGDAGASAVDGSLEVTGSGGLTIDRALTVQHMVQSGGAVTGAGRLVTGDFTWTGGIQGGQGTTEVTSGGAGLSLDGDNHAAGGSRTLRIDPGAQAVWTAGNLDLRDSSRLDNAGLLDIQGNQDFTGDGGDATVINEAGGTIRRSAGDGEVVLTYALANDGELEVKTGTFTVQASTPPGDDSDGVFRVAKDARLRFVYANTFSPVSKITGDGEVVFAGGVQQVYGAVDAPLVVDGAQVNLNADVTVPRIELDKGALGGPATTTTPDLRWESGSLVGTGKTEIAIGGAGLNVDSPQGHGLFDRALVIDPGAEAHWLEGTIVMLGSALLDNHGILDIRGDVATQGCCDSRTSIHNESDGILRKSAGGGSAVIGHSLQNDGILEAESGTLALQAVQNAQSGTLTGGVWIVRATLELGAEVRRNAATLVLDGPRSKLQRPDGTDATGLLDANTADGSLVVTDGRELDVPAGRSDFENAGDLLIGPDSTLRAGGAFRQTGGTTTLETPTSRLVAAGGTVDVQAGTLAGPGVVEGSLHNAGTVSPGPAFPLPEPARAMKVTGDYTQAPGGTLDVTISSQDPDTGHVRLDVGGNAMFAGTLKLETLDGFAPAPGDEFELIRHASSIDEFDTVDGLAPDPAHSYPPPEYGDHATVLRRGPDPQISIADTAVTEGDHGDREARLQVTVTPAPKRPVQLTWNTTDGSATSPSDYESASGTLTLHHGETSAVLSVPVHGDQAHEPDETFHVDLSGVSGASVAAGRGTVTIANDDPAPQPTGSGDPTPSPDPGPGPTPAPGPGPTGPAAGGPPARKPDPRRPKPRPARRCVDRLAPLSRLSRPRAPRAATRRRLTLRGRAHDQGCATLKRVGVAVARRVKRHGQKRCRWLGKRGRFGRPARCDRPRWLGVRGAARWELTLRRPLPVGSYVARSRAVDRAGNRELRVRRHGRGGPNEVRFRVR